MAAKVFASDSLLSFAIPKGTQCIQDSDEMIEVMNRDEQFSVVPLPINMETTETDDLPQLIENLAEEAEIYINEFDRLSFKNDIIVGEVFAISQDDDIFVFGHCGNDERRFAFQITPPPTTRTTS